MIYEPSDDSYLLQKTLTEFLETKDKSIKIIDMCSGSGIQAETCMNLGFKNTSAVDINKESIKYLKEKKIPAVKSDIFKNLKNKKFDLIVCNPPYLPEDKIEPEDSKLATTGGKNGYEFINKFLTQAKNHLSKNGEILLLFSSLSKPRIILRHSKNLGYNCKLLDKDKIPFEELYVYKFSIK